MSPKYFGMANWREVAHLVKVEVSAKKHLLEVSLQVLRLEVKPAGGLKHWLLPKRASAQ